MRLKKIIINNFRGVRSAEIEGFKRINFFLGKNNSCKTTILEAIFLNIGLTNPMLSININRLRDLRQTEADDFRFIFYNLDYQNIPKFESHFDENNHVRTLEIVPHKCSSTNGSLNKKELDEDIIISSIETSLEKKAVDGITLKTSIKERRQQRKFFSSEVIREGISFLITEPKEYKESVTGVFLFSSSPDPKLDTRLERLIVKKAHKPIVDILNTIDNSIRDLSLGTNGMIYFDIGIERLIPINLAGDGIRSILSILVTVADTKDGIIVIDEIDTGLHFSSQSTLLKAVLQATEEYNVQIFATTHNYETLRNLKDVLDNEEMERHRTEIKTFTLRRTPDNKINSYSYDYEKLHYAIGQEIEIR